MLKIKYIVVFLFSIINFSFCLSHDLVELINKYDFVNFKKAYEATELSEKQKNYLLGKVNEVIGASSEKFRICFCRAPRLSDGKGLRLQSKFGSILACIIFSLGPIGSALLALKVYKENKGIFSKYSATAANFVPYAYCANFAQYIAERDTRISNNSKNYRVGFYIPVFTCLYTLFILLLKAKDKMGFLIYKQWKKAVKIRDLMKDTKGIRIKSESGGIK